MAGLLFWVHFTFFHFSILAKNVQKNIPKMLVAKKHQKWGPGEAPDLQNLQKRDTPKLENPKNREKKCFFEEAIFQQILVCQKSVKSRAREASNLE